MGSRVRPGSENLVEETARFTDAQTATLVKGYVPDACCPRSQPRSVRRARSVRRIRYRVTHSTRRRARTSPFLSDFRDLQVGDYVVHIEHGIAQYLGLKEIDQGDGKANTCSLSTPMPRASTSAHTPGPDPEIPLSRGRETRAQSPWHAGLGQD